MLFRSTFTYKGRAVDPSNDPHSLQAAAEVRERLERLVEAAETQFRCCNCGQSPYAKQSANGHTPAAHAANRGEARPLL